ncbi:cytochrome P450 [Frankia sp. AgB1.9]|nr:cytochrome P450 [Frankia sp. AgW1.1]MBL7553794.1 cytochrome P450 [Frankia sp. AgB1.9]MBL7617893.1 cytochrome P450 [Frankia sp. AgB1.8]
MTMIGLSEGELASEWARRYPAHAGGAVRLYGEEFHRDPAAVYWRLRSEHGPVAPVLVDGAVPAWLVLDYREFGQVLENPAHYTRDSAAWNSWDLIPADWPLIPMITKRNTVWFLTGDEHHRRVSVLADGLGAVDPFELRTASERVADALIDAFADRGRGDLIAEYAELLPLRVTTALLGIPPADSAAIVADLAVVVNGGPDAVAANLRLRAGLQAQVSARRERPRFDVLSRLVAHPVGLGDGELLEELQTVFAIVHQATSAWIGNTLRLMLGDSRFATTILGGRRSVGEAMAEVLWEDPPGATLTGRWAVGRRVLGRYFLEAGDLLLLSIAAANTDPKIRPGMEIIHRNQAHLAYGYGEHRCPLAGQEIGEAIAETAVQVLLDRLPDVELALPIERLLWRPSLWLRSLVDLPVVFTPPGP